MLVTELITGEEVYLKRWSVCCDNYSKIRKKYCVVDCGGEALQIKQHSIQSETVLGVKPIK